MQVQRRSNTLISYYQAQCHLFVQYKYSGWCCLNTVRHKINKMAISFSMQKGVKTSPTEYCKPHEFCCSKNGAYYT